MMSLSRLLAGSKKLVPEGKVHIRHFLCHLKDHWRFHKSLGKLIFLVAHNTNLFGLVVEPTKSIERCRPSFKDIQSSIFYRSIKSRLGQSF